MGYFGLDKIGRFFVLINYRRRKNRMMEHMLNKKKDKIVLLDIGCGDGGFLRYIKTKFNNWGLYGIEPTPHKNTFSEGITIYNKELMVCGFKEQQFDVITMSHVIEHIKEPDKLLNEMKRVLKDDGMLIISCPNVGGFGYKMTGKNWFHLDPARHVSQFDTDSLTSLLDKNGFKIMKLNYLLIEFPFDLLRSIINKFTIKNSSIIDRFFKIAIAIIFVIPSIFLKFISKLLKISETIELVASKS